MGGVPERGVSRGYLPGGILQVLPPVNRMADRCKTITLPQTSFGAVMSVCYCAFDRENQVVRKKINVGEVEVCSDASQCLDF